jgi:hypothetical protein
MTRRLTEWETIEVAKRHSLARFGDGEINILYGQDARYQECSEALAYELNHIMHHAKCRVAGPHVLGPRAYYWLPFLRTHRTRRWQYSSFITRMDEAPWIDTPEYREHLTSIWKDKDVVLVRGRGSLTADMLVGAKSVREVVGLTHNAYLMIDKLEEKIGTPELAILCLGATATCLTNRLAQKGVHAVDLGYVGSFL